MPAGCGQWVATRDRSRGGGHAIEPGTAAHVAHFYQFPGSILAVRLTDGIRASLIVDGGQMESRSVFISSLSRRQLARRRPSRSRGPAQLLIAVALVLVLIAIAAVIVARGGM
jgi:hypothetical protein